MFCPACLPLVERTAEPRRFTEMPRSCYSWFLPADPLGAINGLLEDEADGDSVATDP